MNINEQILDQLMTAVENGSPLDFAEALDTALKSKAADAIDARRDELASGIHEARKCAKEEDEDYDEELEEGLDPVGKEDGDVDNDGDEDESDEYLKNRREKISKAIKEEDEDEDEDEDDELEEAKMDDSEVLSAAKRLAKNGKDAKAKKFGQGLVDFYAKNKSFTPDQVAGLQNIMKNASFQLAKESAKRGPAIKGKVQWDKGRPAGGKPEKKEDDGKHKGVKRGPSIKGKIDWSKGRPAG